MVAASRAGRIAARWWVDDETGLVLWQETYDRNGAVELSFGFTSVRITPAAEMIDHLLPRLAGSTATTSLTTSNGSWLRASGWYCGAERRRALPGPGAQRRRGPIRARCT